MKRHFQCVEQVKSPLNLTKYCACHEILKLKISADTPWMLPPIERRFEDNPTISEDNPTISEDNPTIKSSSRTRRFGDLTRPILETILYCKIQHLALRLSPKMSRSAAPVTKSHPPTSPNTAPATQNECHQWSASHMKPHFQCVEQVKSPSNLTKYCACACHEILKLISADTPWMLTELWLYWTVTLLNCYFTELNTFTGLLLYWTVTLTESVTLLNCYFTELLLYWICYLTELLLYWTVTLLNCDFTELWTLLNCYFTDLVLHWTVTLLNCYFTELWLYWTVTLLNCYFTELWLY